MHWAATKNFRHVSRCPGPDPDQASPEYNTEAFYVHVTVHRNKFLLNETNRRTNFPNLFLSRNSTCFGQFLCLSSGVFHSTFDTGICHAVLMTAFKHDKDGRACKLSSNLHDIYQCRMYSGKLLMMGRGTARNI